MEIEILHNDEDIIVCVKPQGIISQVDVGGKTNMVDILKEKFESEIYPVHRLDKETGGIMVFAKNKKSAAYLSGLITEQRFHKEYMALLHNDITPENDTLTDLLFHDRQKNKSYVVKRQRNGVKKAILDYEKIATKSINDILYSLVKVNLKTGRTHQIRVQFSYRGYPLLGDKKYGAQDNERTLGLWAYKITFNHPKTKETMHFEYLPKKSSFI